MINSRPSRESSLVWRRQCWNSVMTRWNIWWDYQSDTARHCGHVLVAIVFFFFAQLLTCAWNQPFWKYGIDFPGQIVAMVFVWLFMWAVQLAFFRPGEGVERVYYRYLKAPTEVLNKHMSIGFTVPFLSLISQSFVGGSQVGLLTTAFVMTGVLNAVLVYTVAYHVQLRLTELKPSTRGHSESVLEGAPRDHVDIHHPTRPVPTFTFRRYSAGFSAERGAHERDPVSRLDRFRKHVSDVSTLCTLSGYASDYNGANIAYGAGQVSAANAGRPEDALRTLESGTGTGNPTSEQAYARQRKITQVALTWAKRHIFLTLSILLFVFPGLFLSFFHATDFPLDVGFLFTVWLTFTSAQTRVKQHLLQHQPRPQHRKTLTAITTLLNPVLWTSLALLCYGLAKAHIRAISAATIVARFKTGTTVSDLIANHFTTTITSTTTTSASASPLFGAGDLATSILNAGIVSWGLKLFEYRAPLLSRGGLTVLLVSAITAALNVIAWPLLASHALGVRPAASALSFVARSVTIALGGPAVARLGGDSGVNAVGVVVNGIVFQLVAGCFAVRDEDGAGGRLERWRALCGAYVRRLSCWRIPGSPRGAEAEKTHITAPLGEQDRRRYMRYSSDATHLDDGRLTPLPAPPSSPPSSSSSSEPFADDSVCTVAAGVTIGINAAAMGTSHLYEQASGAAAYSALAMTVFGVFTVLFTVPSPMVVWLRGMVEA